MKAAATTRITWRGRRIDATVPHLLARQTFELRPTVDTSCKSATSRLVLAAEVVPPDFATLAHLMARNEALASSYIEGIGAPTLDIVLPDPSPIARSLNDAIATVQHVRNAADTDVSVEVLCDWHARVMRSTTLPREHHGHLRTEQGWIGGSSPLDAALVTPPADKIPPLVDDLIDFVNRTDLDPILQAAVAHAQFELIHPFADGNGRIGRMLVDWTLARRLRLVAPPSISNVIAGDVGGYLSGLTLFRLGDLDAWVSWFADVVTRASQRQLSLVQAIDELRARWRVRLLARSDSCAWPILGLLTQSLVLDARSVAEEFGVSPRAALSGLESLTAAGILEEHSRPVGKGRPARLFVAPDLLALIDVS